MCWWPAANPFVERVIESMSNPYQSPQSAVMSSAHSASGAGAVIQLVVGLLCAVIAALLPMLVIPTFHEVFISFGAQLPQLTKVAVAYHLWLWLLPLLVVAARLFWPAKHRRSKASCKACGTSRVAPRSQTTGRTGPNRARCAARAGAGAMRCFPGTA